MASPPDWAALASRLAVATGVDPELEAALAEAFGRAPGHVLDSVAACRDLVASALPDWHIHVGFGVSGVMPYAAASRQGERFEAEAPTVPLAILRAAVAALAAQGPGADRPSPSEDRRVS